jgi:hypothetical protein
MLSLSLTPVIERLTAKPDTFNKLWFRKVAGASQYAQIRPESLPLPAAWIVREADKGNTAGDRIDEAAPYFDVVIAIENAREHEPGETDDTLLAYRNAVYQLLRGWQITPEMQPMKWLGGRVIEYTEGDLYWADRYSFDAVITNYPPDPAANFDSMTNTGGSKL